ncbi:MAG TPA: uridine kinase [Candidatus Avilachnospira avicola]|nr:uridine kinase [Candidatus Avilachnospira avicola]
MKPVIIGIAGGTGSGKSTFTNRLKKAFGDSISVLYHDNYYKAHDELPFEERKLLNYDHPDAFDSDLLVHDIMELKEGRSIVSPTYDYTIHNRAKETVLVEPRKVILIEGILTLYDPRLRELMDIKIFVDADADERILRRVIRDTKERGRDIENIVDQYLTTVKPMHYLYVEPTKRLADIVVNSGKNPIAFRIIKNTIKEILDSTD